MARTETVTVIFTDLVGSTELAGRVGHDAYEALRHSHFEALRAAVIKHNGAEIKTTGDGLMLCFTSAADAVACAVAMQQAADAHARRNPEQLTIRIGASSGEATREDHDLYGPPVVEASRLCAAASAGQILASDVVRALARGRGHKFTPIGELELKGLSEPLPTCEVGWEPLDASGAIPLPPKLAPAPALGLFGRASEQAIIARCWQAAKQGQRQLLLLGGEPGIGKTRLATEAARAAHAEDAAVMFGSCDENITLPYRPFVEALRHYVAHAPDEVLAAHVKEHNGELTRLVPELAHRIPNLAKPQAAEAETQRYLMFEAATGILAVASQQNPVLLILDDVQWAGAPDLLLLRHIVRSTIPMRVMIVATYRDAELSRTHPLTALLADLRRETGIERIALRGLDDEAVIALVTAAAGHELDTAGIALAYAIHRETEGSPLFIGEILRNLTESGAVFREGDRWTYRGDLASLGIPQGVKEAIGRRLARLPESTNKVLSLASVIGREFDLALLAKIAELSEDAILDAIDEAKAAALVAETAGDAERFSFTHALIRATLYDELTGARRARMHRRVGEALEALVGARPDERIDELAYHWLSATKVSDAAKAIGYARRAAEKALAGLAFEEAAKYYEQALSALEPHDREGELLRCDLLIALGDARRLALAALGNGRTGGIFASGQVLSIMLIALYEEALKALGNDDSELRARLLANLSDELMYTEFRERRHQLSREAVEIARRLSDNAALFHALAARAFAINDPTTLADRLSLTAEMETLASDLGKAEERWAAA
jgi:class 3 adenylate cyclase